MRKRDRGDIKESRWLDIQQGCKYTGLGKSSFRKLAENAGAVVKIGKIVRFDKVIIDQAMDKARENTQKALTV